MASGEVHLRVTLFLAPVAGVTTFLVTGSPALALWSTVGCLAGVLLTPDLDQESINYVEWMLIRVTLGLGYLWLAFWGPYSTLLRHRSWVSHGPLIGTLGRILYIQGGLYVLEVLGLVHPLPRLQELVRHPAFLAAVGGLALSDLGHWLFDYLPARRVRTGDELMKKTFLWVLLALVFLILVLLTLVFRASGSVVVSGLIGK